MLVITRIGVGLSLILHYSLVISTGIGNRHNIASEFPYAGLEFMAGWIDPSVVIWFSLACAILFTIGAGFRMACAGLVVGFGLLLFRDVTEYSNFEYLAMLTVLLFIPTTANRRFAVDAKLFEKTASNTTPLWPILLLQFQATVAYFFGGISKLTSDWFGGEPLRTWLTKAAPDAIFPSLWTAEYTPVVMSIGGCAFDLLIPFFLIRRRTRVVAFIVLVAFHITNEYLISVGVLPWFMIASAIIFFTPVHETAPSPSKKISSFATAFIVFWIVLQCAIPMRFVAYPGYSKYTMQGQRFAWWWRYAQFDADVKYYVELEGKRERVELRKYITAKQAQKFPYHQFVIRLAHKISKDKGNAPVFADLKVSLNQRKIQSYVDPNTDLSKVPISWGTQEWILPFESR